MGKADEVYRSEGMQRIVKRAAKFVGNSHIAKSLRCVVPDVGKMSAS
jgi:hypothetical protein